MSYVCQCKKLLVSRVLLRCSDWLLYCYVVARLFWVFARALVFQVDFNALLCGYLGCCQGIAKMFLVCFSTLQSVLAHFLGVLVEINEGICHYKFEFFPQCSSAAHINMKNRSVTIVSYRGHQIRSNLLLSLNHATAEG